MDVFVWARAGNQEVGEYDYAVANKERKIRYGEKTEIMIERVCRFIPRLFAHLCRRVPEKKIWQSMLYISIFAAWWLNNRQFSCRSRLLRSGIRARTWRQWGSARRWAQWWEICSCASVRARTSSSPPTSWARSRLGPAAKTKTCNGTVYGLFWTSLTRCLVFLFFMNAIRIVEFVCNWNFWGQFGWTRGLTRSVQVSAYSWRLWSGGCTLNNCIGGFSCLAW